MIMYMTQFPINLTLRETRSILASPYRLHAAIAGCFTPQEGGLLESRVLWRIDDVPNGGKNLLIVSPDIPDLRGLNEQIGWETKRWKTADYESFLEGIQKGQVYRFRLKANPVVSRSKIKDGAGRSKHLSHLTLLQQEAWLVGKEAFENAGHSVPEQFPQSDTSRAERAGFAIEANPATDLLNLCVSQSQKIQFKAGASGRPITLTTVLYDGVLRVLDADKLRHALIAGMGRAKGFGCGLITLSR